MSTRAINPYTDIFVRYLLGDEKNKDLLISFINAVNEDYDLPPITEVEILSPYNFTEVLGLKESILDVKAKDKFGKLYNIEIQVKGNESYKSRALYYWAKLYSSQIEKGSSYSELKPTISINLIDFNLTESSDFHSCYGIKELNRDDELLTNHLFMHFIELKKFLKESGFKSKMENWLAFFKYEGKREDIMKLVINDAPYINKAHERFKYFTQDDKMMEVYSMREKWEHDVNSNLYEAKQQGIEQGIEQGKVDTANKMINKGLDNNMISEFTELSFEQVEKLRES